MADAFTREYDAYMNAWFDSSLEEGSTSYPVGRRDHTLEKVGDFLVLIAGINNPAMSTKKSPTLSLIHI